MKTLFLKLVRLVNYLFRAEQFQNQRMLKIKWLFPHKKNKESLKKFHFKARYNNNKETFYASSDKHKHNKKKETNKLWTVEFGAVGQRKCVPRGDGRAE